MPRQPNSVPSNTKTIGGAIPTDLYWEFKQAQANRHESSTKALEIAIRLYCDAQLEICNLDKEVM